MADEQDNSGVAVAEPEGQGQDDNLAKTSGVLARPKIIREFGKSFFGRSKISRVLVNGNDIPRNGSVRLKPGDKVNIAGEELAGFLEWKFLQTGKKEQRIANVINQDQNVGFIVPDWDFYFGSKQVALLAFSEKGRAQVWGLPVGFYFGKAEAEEEGEKSKEGGRGIGKAGEEATGAAGGGIGVLTQAVGETISGVATPFIPYADRIARRNELKEALKSGDKKKIASLVNQLKASGDLEGLREAAKVSGKEHIKLIDDAIYETSQAKISTSETAAGLEEIASSVNIEDVDAGGEITGEMETEAAAGISGEVSAETRQAGEVSGRVEGEIGAEARLAGAVQTGMEGKLQVRVQGEARTGGGISGQVAVEGRARAEGQTAAQMRGGFSARMESTAASAQLQASLSASLPSFTPEQRQSAQNVAANLSQNVYGNLKTSISPDITAEQSYQEARGSVLKRIELEQGAEVAANLISKQIHQAALQELASQNPQVLESYRASADKIYEDPAKDPIVENVSEEVDFQIESYLDSLNLSEQQKNELRLFLKKNVGRQVWDRFAKECPEKAGAYQNRISEIAAALRRKAEISGEPAGSTAGALAAVVPESAGQIEVEKKIPEKEKYKSGLEELRRHDKELLRAVPSMVIAGGGEEEKEEKPEVEGEQGVPPKRGLQVGQGPEVFPVARPYSPVGIDSVGPKEKAPGAGLKIPEGQPMPPSPGGSKPVAEAPIGPPLSSEELAKKSGPEAGKRAGKPGGDLGKTDYDHLLPEQQQRDLAMARQNGWQLTDSQLSRLEAERIRAVAKKANMLMNAALTKVAWGFWTSVAGIPLGALLGDFLLLFKNAIISRFLGPLLNTEKLKDAEKEIARQIKFSRGVKLHILLMNLATLALILLVILFIAGIIWWACQDWGARGALYLSGYESVCDYFK